MYRRRSGKIPLGGWLIFAVFLLVLCMLQLVTNSTLLSQGVTTQAVVISEGPVSCTKPPVASTLVQAAKVYTVQFTDRSGQKQTGIISQCSYSINANPGDSITVVYDPNDLSTIEPLSDLKASTSTPIWPIITTLVGLVTLVLLFFWIRKRRARRILLHIKNPS